jgi:hypothetical protein
MIGGQHFLLFLTPTRFSIDPSVHLCFLKYVVRGMESKDERSLHTAVARGNIPVIAKYIEESNGCIGDATGEKILLGAARWRQLSVMLYLLKHGAIMTDTTSAGLTVWDVLESKGLLHLRPMQSSCTTIALRSILRTLALRGAPPNELVACLTPEVGQLVREGAQLRARLPEYFAQRRVLLDAHCPLIAPLQTLVLGYEIPITDDEIWAIGLGACVA